MRVKVLFKRAIFILFRRYGFVATWLFVMIFFEKNFALEKIRLSVLSPDQTQVRSLSAVRQRGFDFVSIQELAGLFDLRVFINLKNKKTVLRIDNKAIKITANNPFIVIDGEVVQMVFPTIYIENEIYVPVAQFLQTVGVLLPEKLEYDPKSQELIVRKSPFNIASIDIEEKLNGTLIQFKTFKEFNEGDVATSVNGSWLYVTLYGGRLDSTQLAADSLEGLVRKIVPFQFEKSAQISFLLNDDIKEREVYTSRDKITLTLYKQKTDELKSVNLPVSDRKKWLIDRIIIDPGHGGRDPGAVNKKTKLKEKTITLDIAKRLKNLLQKKLDADILMTRESDQFIALQDRTKFANSHHGKLFISIHINANENSTVRGFSSWFLGAAKTPQALEVQELENSVIELEESVEAYEAYQHAAHILNAIAQNTHIKESEDLARIVNREMKKRLQIPEQGVYQAGFYVLVGSSMPTILVEAGHITNSYEEKQLRSNWFRQKVAEALCESICKFKRKYEKGIGAG